MLISSNPIHITNLEGIHGRKPLSIEFYIWGGFLPMDHQPRIFGSIVRLLVTQQACPFSICHQNDKINILSSQFASGDYAPKTKKCCYWINPHNKTFFSIPQEHCVSLYRKKAKIFTRRPCWARPDRNQNQDKKEWKEKHWLKLGLVGAKIRVKNTINSCFNLPG